MFDDLARIGIHIVSLIA